MMNHSTDNRPRLTEIRLGADAGGWNGAGFSVVDGAVQIGAVTISIVAPSGGILGLAFDHLPEGVSDIDGLPVAIRPAAGTGAGHVNRAIAVDQVVIATPDFERTINSLDAAGLSIRSERVVEGEGEEGTVRQGFVRAGEPVIEIVHTESVPDGQAVGWGLGFICSDLEATAEEFEGLLGALRPAVQPGRRIATFSRDAGLGVPAVLLDAEAPKSKE